MTASENGAEGKLAVSSRAEELGENVGEIDAKVEGEDAKIAFNSRFLSDVLDVLGDDEVALENDDSVKSGRHQASCRHRGLHVHARSHADVRAVVGSLV